MIVTFGQINKIMKILYKMTELLDHKQQDSGKRMEEQLQQETVFQGALQK